MSFIYVQLRGGLGNQLFQYAAGRSIALAQGAKLIIDNKTGFVRDHTYRRKYNLYKLSILGRFADIWSICIFLFKLLIARRSKTVFPRFIDRLFGTIIFENDFRFQEHLLLQRVKDNLWLVGYWQSPKYFEKNRLLLSYEVMPPKPKDKTFTYMGHKIRNCDSVALGLRLYEESNNPENHSGSGRVKSIQDINNAVDLIRTQRPNCRFFIFCTHRAAIINELNLPKDSVYVTAEDGFVDSIDCLWLLTQCKHHIFTNSSFYWWGAWLSEAVHPNTEQLIYAADNFINADGLCDHWHRF